MAGRFLPAETPPIHTCVLAPRTSALSLCPPPQVWPLDREWFLAADIALHLRIFSPCPPPPPQVWPLDREWFLAPDLALDGSSNNTSNVVGRKR